MNEITRFVQAVLDQSAEQDAAEETRYAEIEAEGFRIVDGGQTTSYDDDSKCGYQIRDFRTGDVLVRGYGTPGDFDAAWDALAVNLGQPLYHRDRIYDEIRDAGDYHSLPETTLPKSLAEALREWADANEDDARAWIAATA